MKTEVSSHPEPNIEPMEYWAGTLTTTLRKCLLCESQNHYLSHAYGKESFGTWGVKPCTVPGEPELQIHMPYVLSKGSGNDPS